MSIYFKITGTTPFSTVPRSRARTRVRYLSLVQKLRGRAEKLSNQDEQYFNVLLKNKINPKIFMVNKKMKM